MGIYCDNFPPLWLIIPSPRIFSLQSTTLSDYSTDLTSFYCDSNNIEVTVNTTCIDVFRVKQQRTNQMGYIIVIAQVARDLWL